MVQKVVVLNIWVFPKIRVPPNYPFIHFDRVFHYFNHPFWAFYPYFWNSPIICLSLYQPDVSAAVTKTLVCLGGVYRELHGDMVLPRHPFLTKQFFDVSYGF